MYQKLSTLRKISLIMGVALLLMGFVPGVLAGVPAVFADGEVTPTEEPAADITTTQEATVSDPNIASTEEPTAEPTTGGETAVVEDTTVTEEVVATATPTGEVAADSTPTEEAVVDESPTAEPTADTQDSQEADASEVVQALADAGAVLVDENNDPVSLTSNEASNLLTSGDPYFTRGGTTYYFLTDCTGYSNCTVSANPIQAAIDDVDANGLPDDGTIYVEAGTYNEHLTIGVDNLTLYGDPGDPTQAGAGANAPILDGGGSGTGIFIDGNGVTITGFIIQNFHYGIKLNASGNKGFNANNNDFKNNDVAVYNQNAVPGVELHYNIFENNSLAIQNDDVNGLQYIEAQNNYWGCTDGPIVQYWDSSNSKWVYVLWATKAEVDPSNYPGCEFVYGGNDFWDHQIHTSDYSPFKINIGTLATEEIPGCTNPQAINYNPDATSDDGSCEFEGPVYGCTDPNAINYDSYATVDDESCRYDLQLSATCMDVQGKYQIVWEVYNPNFVSVDATWSLDGNNGGGTLGADSTVFIGYTNQGPSTHTLDLSWELGDYTLNNSSVCAPTTTTNTPPGNPGVPVTGAGGPIIPVTGADLTGQTLLSFGGVLLVGLSLLVKGVAGKIKK